MAVRRMINPSLSFVKLGHWTEQRCSPDRRGGREEMNRLNDSEALDTFRQTVARIVRRLLEEDDEQHKSQEEDRKSCHSGA
jgi:hypothetical protein